MISFQCTGPFLLVVGQLENAVVALTNGDYKSKYFEWKMHVDIYMHIVACFTGVQGNINPRVLMSELPCVQVYRPYIHHTYDPPASRGIL